MEYIIIAAIIVVVIAVIAYPLFNGTGPETASTPNALDEFIAQRDSAYDAIRDLDFDFQMGKLSQSDYEALRDKYKARAAQALQQIDAAVGADGADTRIEEQVARLREKRSGAKAPSTNGNHREDDVEQEVARLREKRSGAKATATNGCPNCGAPYRAGDQFCSKCGAKL